jgi:hypothetical protein
MRPTILGTCLGGVGAWCIVFLNGLTGGGGSVVAGACASADPHAAGSEQGSVSNGLRPITGERM